MKLALAIFVLIACYYTLTYAVSLWKDDNNKPAGTGAALLAFLGTAFPLYMIFLRDS